LYYAHSAPSREQWEPLRVHLAAVAARAGAYAGAFGAADEGQAAGLLHDLGKYSERFTRRLEGREQGLDHWSLGAWAALEKLRQAGIAIALAVQGHHVGLQRGDGPALRELLPRRLAERHPLGLALTETDVQRLLDRFAADGLELPAVDSSLFSHAAPRGAGMLDVRMLFSALVDADYLETEAHFLAVEPEKRTSRPAGQSLRPAEALSLLNERVAELARDAPATPEVLRLRADLLSACAAAAELAPGLFTLSAPTGAGKTMAMLAFALRHALCHGLRRVVIVIPYLSILEQTARVYRELLEPTFGPGYLLEQHSLAGTRGSDPAGANDRDETREARRGERQLAENWDAPLVLTTSVQLLESLFANRPAACRKLHRLADSVLLFDEVQTLPLRLAVPTLAALSHLSQRYRATVVFSTATQPAFDHLDGRVRELAGGGWQPREVAPKELRLFERARRTREVWSIDAATPWAELAGKLAGEKQTLVIVNLKRHAAELARRLAASGAQGVLHLSTSLCPAHRARVLAAVRRRLDAGEACRLVATQCVEAGVDLDFPIVYRAFGPLEAIAQAAGRCNRNGRLGSSGEVRIFLPEEQAYPPGGYRQAAGATMTLLRQRGAEAMDLQSPDLFRAYYRLLYEWTGIDTGDAGAARELRDAIDGLDFPAVSGLYRLIDQDAINVVVPYDLAAYDALRHELRSLGRLTAGWVQSARAHTVSLYRPKPDDPIHSFLDPAPLGRGEPERSADWFVYLEPAHYDRDLLGLMAAESLWIA
jgi:CRISPR-associated endonuclease/helicase Cas3